MKYIVTGGAGFIGSHIVDALVADGHQVVVVDDLSAGRKENINPQAEFHQKDIKNLDDIAPLFNGVDGVFHLAALPSVQLSIDDPAKTHLTNVDGALNVLLAARQAGVKRLVNSSSGGVYGDAKVFPQSESSPINPKSPYTLQKYITEGYCRLFSSLYNLATINLRYFNVYGPRMPYGGPYSGVIRVFLRQQAAGEPLTITGDGEQSRDYVFVNDVVKANLLAMKSDKVGQGEAINIGTGREYTVNQIADLIGGEKKYIAPRIEPRRSVADIQLAQKLLGWQPQVSFAEGIELCRHKNRY